MTATPAAEPWPLRYRLYRGRKMHVAYQTEYGDTITACQRTIGLNDEQINEGAYELPVCVDCRARLRNPRVGDPRQHTASVESVNAEGHRVTTVKLKRCCNGCGETLGDADNRDVDRHGNLTDVRAECPTCTPGLAVARALGGAK